MKIGVDGNLISCNKTGMGVVVYNVLKYWKQNNEFEVHLYVTKQLDKETETVFKNNSIIIKVLGEYNYLLWEQVIIPRETKKDSIDVLWCPYNTAPLFPGCKIVLSIHDMIFMNASLRKTPSLYKKMGIIYRRLLVPIVAKRATALVTVSQFSKKELVKYFSDKKINVIYNAVEENEGIDTISGLKRLKDLGVRKEYILAIGSLEYRKNTRRVIEAYENLPINIRKEYQLVLFGFRGYEESYEKKYIDKKFVSGEVIVLGYISDHDKNVLYSQSSFFVYPSLSEGFGLPILEAFSFKTPVITSNVTSMPEVAGDAALYVDPENVQDIQNAMLDLLRGKQLREELVIKGTDRIRCFSWEKSSMEYRKLFMSIN